MQTQLAMPELAYVVGGLLLTTIIFLILFVRQVIISQRLTNDNEADHKIHVARTAEATTQRDKWKNEATTLNAEKESLVAQLENLRARHETDTLTFGRELRAAQDERDYFKKEMETARARYTTAKQDVDDAYQTLDSVNKDRDELNRKCNTLAGMVRTLTDKLAEMNEAVDSLVDKRALNGSKQARVGGKFSKVITTVDEQKEYKTPTPVKQISEVVKEMEKPETIEPTEQKDHPCLTGCSKPDGCFCPPSVPKSGTMYVRHPRSFFVEKGILLDEPNGHKDEAPLMHEWASNVGLEYMARTTQNGDVKNATYTFRRPAVNSDFDIPNAAN
jgi:uncharacterized coiled-coil DUF342 family protein